MSKTLGWLSWLVTARPYVTLVVLVIITVALAAGASLRAPLDETDGFFPPGSAIVQALDEIDTLFGESGKVDVVTLLFRGEALTPGGLSQMDALIDDIAGDPDVAELLAPGHPIVAPTSLIEAGLRVDSFESVTQAQIDSARSAPELQEALAAMTGTDTDGTPVAIATIRLRDTGDERIQDAERKINELANGDEGPLRVSSVSPVVIEDEYQEASRTGMAPLIGGALVLIAALILLFLRSPSDLLLTLMGLLMALLWVVGAEGWLGPNGLALLGRPSGISAMIPIIIISLTVDYAIQVASHYREQRTAHASVLAAVQSGLQIVIVPLALAAVTTIVSFLVGLLSPIPAIGDFGVVAGLGVGMSLIVMLTLVPAGRLIIDRRRESRGTLAPPRPVSKALPGIERAAELLGRGITRAPAAYIVVVLVVTIALGFAATGLESEFSIRDILPRGGSVLKDMNTLDAAVGGSTEMVSVLVKAEATETRTLLNLHDLTTAFQDELRRPGGAAGPIQASYELLVQDWTDDSGEPGDRYDPELDALFREASVGVQLDQDLMQEFLDKLEVRDPALVRVLVNDPEGVDAMLLQFPAFSDDPEQTKLIQEDIEALWFGDDRAITATSGSIVSVTVTDEITSRQTEAIVATIAVALGILMVFFWATLRQPVLAFIAVGPLVLVLIWVLGTMALLGIPYTLVTSIITALSIGIGVDYTIHVIHRYREEFYRLRNPETAAIRTLGTTGSALLGSAMTTAIGLGMLILSPALALQQFGITVVITIVYALMVSTLLVPPAMTVWGAYRNMRLRSMVERQWAEFDVAVEDVHRRYEAGQGSS